MIQSSRKWFDAIRQPHVVGCYGMHKKIKVRNVSPHFLPGMMLPGNNVAAENASCVCDKCINNQNCYNGNPYGNNIDCNRFFHGFRFCFGHVDCQLILEDHGTAQNT